MWKPLVIISITVKHKMFVARNFHGFQIFIISLHVIFAELTIYYMGYLTAVKFRCIFQNREYSENYMRAKISCFTVSTT